MLLAHLDPLEQQEPPAQAALVAQAEPRELLELRDHQDRLDPQVLPEPRDPVGLLEQQAQQV